MNLAPSCISEYLCTHTHCYIQLGKHDLNAYVCVHVWQYRNRRTHSQTYIHKTCEFLPQMEGPQVKGTGPTVVRWGPQNDTAVPETQVCTCIHTHIHTQVDAYLTFGGQSWRLESVLFHAPAEHTVGGKSFDLEVQWLYTNLAGQVCMHTYIHSPIRKYKQHAHMHVWHMYEKYCESLIYTHVHIHIQKMAVSVLGLEGRTTPSFIASVASLTSHVATKV